MWQTVALAGAIIAVARRIGGRSLAIGGQGLGLANVRMIARSRSVEVRFVPPRRGFSTTIELSWQE